MSQSPPIRESLSRVRAWFDANAPGHGPVLLPGVAGVEGVLSELFDAVGGQDGGDDVFDFHCLLTPDDVVREREMMDELARTEPWPESWWHPSWVPFASDYAGQLLVVDERSGEVVSFVHDDDPREVLAPSLAAYFDGVASDLESGRRVFDERFGVVFADDLERLIERRAARVDAEAPAGQLGFYLLAAAVGVGVMVVAYLLDL